MRKPSQRDTLVSACENAERSLEAAREALWKFDSEARNHTYESLELALPRVKELLVSRARHGCTTTYTQYFSVQGQGYLARLKVTYHDGSKSGSRVFHVDDMQFSLEALDAK